MDRRRVRRGESFRIWLGYGEPLEWEELESKRACRVACYRMGEIEDPQDKVDEYLAWPIDRVLRMKRVFGPMLSAVSADLEPVRPV